ncbi:MAG: DUF29 domain-containing protein [Massilia sp.]
MERVELPGPAYADDVVLWLRHQIALLRAGQFAQLDRGKLVDELEDLVRSEHRALRHRLEILVVHLLKCQCQPARKSASWHHTLVTQRLRIVRLFDDSPSLRRLVAGMLERDYPLAVLEAAHQTGLAHTAFPATLPFTEQQVLDPDFLP